MKNNNPCNQKDNAESQRVKKGIEDNRSNLLERRVHSVQLMKAPPVQRFRQDRPNAGNQPGTALGWRRKHTATRQSGHGNYR